MSSEKRTTRTSNLQEEDEQSPRRGQATSKKKTGNLQKRTTRASNPQEEDNNGLWDIVLKCPLLRGLTAVCMLLHWHFISGQSLVHYFKRSDLHATMPGLPQKPESLLKVFQIASIPQKMGQTISSYNRTLKKRSLIEPTKGRPRLEGDELTDLTLH